MSIRLSIECYRGLMIASNRTGLSYTQIGNKAMCKFDRLKTNEIVASFDNYTNDYNLMEQPINIRFKPSLIKGKSPALQRHILTWYLCSTKVYPKQSPVNITKADIDLMYQWPGSIGPVLAEQYLQKVE